MMWLGGYYRPHSLFLPSTKLEDTRIELNHTLSLYSSTMRVLPPTYLGHHPAFPASKELSESDPRLAGCTTAGMMVGVSTYFLLFEPENKFQGQSLQQRQHRTLIRPLPAAIKATAAATGLCTVLQIFPSTMKRRRAEGFLRRQGIEPPKFQLVDRIGYIDELDTELMLGAMGVWFAGRIPRPNPSIGPIVWRVAFGMVGFDLGETHHFLAMAIKQRAEFSKARMEQ